MRTEQIKNSFQAVIASFLVVAMTVTTGCGPTTYDPMDEAELEELSAEVKAQTLTLEVTSATGERSVEKAKLDEMLSAVRAATGDKNFKPASVLGSNTSQFGSLTLTNKDGQLQSNSAEDALSVKWNLDRSEVIFNTPEGPVTVKIKGTSDRRAIANAIGALTVLTFHSFEKALQTGNIEESDVSTQAWWAVVVVIVASCLVAKAVCAGIAYVKCKSRGGVRSWSASCGGFPPKLTCKFVCRR